MKTRKAEQQQQSLNELWVLRTDRVEAETFRFRSSSAAGGDKPSLTQEIAPATFQWQKLFSLLILPNVKAAAHRHPNPLWPSGFPSGTAPPARGVAQRLKWLFNFKNSKPEILRTSFEKTNDQKWCSASIKVDLKTWNQRLKDKNYFYISLNYEK